ncbi:MAG: FAD-dependent oxidoreductase [Rhodomicrobium sp.]|nr:FAD-dependent oxidoreductase [Rhodomicrobium sp.]
MDVDHAHLIVGGGIYGCYTALKLAEAHGGKEVAIVEREADLLRRASYNNQARVHNGYHYPRSILTALRSRVNAPRFLDEFGDAIVSDFEQYYAIARRRSNVTPGQFEEFCRRIGAHLRPAPERIRALFDPELIETVYVVEELVFDADKLRERIVKRLKSAGVRVFLEAEARSLSLGPGTPYPQIKLHLKYRSNPALRELTGRFLYNCTYAALNRLLAASRLQTIRLRHEATEMALIELPPVLKGLSITVMCGPFFSLMPFPARGLATLSHVSYTPHYGWAEDPSAPAPGAHEPGFPLASRFDRMWRDAARYLPVLRDARHVGSLWEVKTILPQSDANDSRPILFKRDPKAPNVISLLGGKIDNIYDIDDILADLHGIEPAFATA